MFGLDDWTVDRFTARRQRLHELQQRGHPAPGAPAGRVPGAGRWPRTPWSSATSADVAGSGDLSLGQAVVFAQVAVGHQPDRVRRPQLGPGRRGGPDRGGAPARGGHGACGSARQRGDRPAEGLPARGDPVPGRRLRLPARGRPVLEGFDLDDPGRRVAGDRRPERRRQDHAGQAAVPALRPDRRRDRGRRHRSARGRRRRLAVAGHRGLPGLRALRAVAARQRRPGGAPDEDVRAALARRRRRRASPISTPRCPSSYAGGTDLSGGQWQRVALARALCAVRRGAGLVLLDEPTAQLDVRGEAAIFERVLARDPRHARRS